MALSTLSLFALLGAVDVTSWEGVDCPASALLERLGSTPTTNPVRVAMRRRGAAYVGVVEVTRDGRVRSSVLEATTCAELIETLALRATLAAAPEPRRVLVSQPAPRASTPTPKAPPTAALPAGVHRRPPPRATAPLPSTAEMRSAVVASEEHPSTPPATAPLPSTAEMRSPVVAAEEQPSTPPATAPPSTTAEVRPPAVAAAEEHPSTPPATAPLPTTAELGPPAVAAASRAAIVSAEAEPVVSVARSATSPEVATPTVVEPDVHLELGASAVLLAGPAPVASFGGAAVVSVAAARLPLRIELVLLHARTPTVVVGPATASFSVSLARLGVCGEPLRLGRLALGGCGAVAGGALWGQGNASDAITEPREVLLPWLDVSVSALAAFTLSGSLRLVARLGPTFPITRHLFVFDSPLVRVHAVGPVGLEGGLGLVYAP